MKKQTLVHFFMGLLIAFSISVLIVSTVLAVASDSAMISVSMIYQVFALSVICSVINLVYRSEKLKFIWQSIIGYILTTSAITACGMIFGWYSYGGNTFDKTAFILVSLLIYTLFYLVTWTIIWRVNKAKKRELNERLKEYKQLK